MIGLNPEGHQVAGFGQLACLGHGVGERGFIQHQMVGWHHQQLGVATEMLLHVQCRHRNGRCGVATERLQQQVQRQPGLVDSAVVIQGAKQQVAISDGQHTFHAGQARGTLKGFLQQTLAVTHTHEWLGHVLPGHRPQPRA